jgi:drug/metabolite transporter (DMT)-like permease
MLGILYIVGYVVFIGVATFLIKVGMKDLNAYQLNLLMGLGMLIIGIPAIWIAQKGLQIPVKSLPLGAAIGLMMAAGSLFFILAVTKMPVGLASALATSYVVLVVLLSWLFLKESIDLVKGLGIVLTVAGVAILSYKG